MLYSNYNYIEELIGLKDICVNSIKRENNQLHIDISTPQRPHKCPQCGEITSKIHDYRIQSIKDIPLLGECTILHLRKRRYVCPKCKKRFYEDISFLPKYHRITNRLAAYVINLLKEAGSIKSVAKAVNLSQTTVTRIFDNVEYSNKTLPRVISLDEFRGNAGGEKFQCIITDPEHKKVLDILPNRKAEDLYRYFLKFKERKMVQYVVIDMSGFYRSLAKCLFPNAKIIADRYHVVRQAIWAFENVRKNEQSKFHDTRRKYFKRSRKLLLKKPENLTEEKLLK